MTRNFEKWLSNFKTSIATYKSGIEYLKLTYWT